VASNFHRREGVEEVSKQLALSSHLVGMTKYIGSSGNRLRIFVVCVLTGVVVGLYMNSLSNGFVQWDDPGNILTNKQIRRLDWSNVKEIFTPRRASTYQPIRVLSYAVDYHFWKLSPLGYHLTNIAFYLLTCIMVFFATCELLKFLRAEKTSQSNARISFFAALLFAVHPVHVEAVTWMSGRKEVLLGFFFFASLYCYFKGASTSEITKRRGFYGLAFLGFVLAVLSKPVAVVLPGIILLFELSRGRIQSARFFKKALWFIPALFVSLFFIFILLKVMIEAGGIYPYRGGNFLSNFLFAFRLFILNIKLMALTVNYSPIYILILPHRILGVHTLIYVLLNLGLIGLAISMFKRSKVIFFAIFWFYVTILPFSNIIPISTPLADRYVFIPSFAYCLILALCFERLWSMRLKNLSRDFFPFLALMVLISVLAGYSYMTVRQNRSWKDSFALWSDALAKNPRNPAAMNGLAVIYLGNDMSEEAFDLLKKAVEINPLDPLIHNNLGIACERLGEYAQSEFHYVRALSLKPGYYEARVNLGILASRTGDFEKGIAILIDLLAEHPQDSVLHFRMAYVYKTAGKLEEAIEEYKKSIELTPHIVAPYESLARLYLEKLNDREKALYFFKKGIEMAPNSKRVKEMEAEIRRLTAEQLSLRGEQPHRE